MEYKYEFNEPIMYNFNDLKFNNKIEFFKDIRLEGIFIIRKYHDNIRYLLKFDKSEIVLKFENNINFKIDNFLMELYGTFIDNYFFVIRFNFNKFQNIKYITTNENYENKYLFILNYEDIIDNKKLTDLIIYDERILTGIIIFNNFEKHQDLELINKIILIISSFIRNFYNNKNNKLFFISNINLDLMFKLTVKNLVEFKTNYLLFNDIAVINNDNINIIVNEENLNIIDRSSMLYLNNNILALNQYKLLIIINNEKNYVYKSDNINIISFIASRNKNILNLIDLNNYNLKILDKL